ncbi:MAG: PH domain-containing protein [Deltaproteobacteria bacterium]
MSYVEANLMKDEKIRYKAELHWMIYVGPAILCVVLIGFPLLLWQWIRATTSEFAITNQRVMIKVGFISRKSLELKLNKVESIGVDQGILGRVLNYGAIVVVGTGGTRERFPMIKDPLGFRKAVNDATEALQSPMQAIA